MTDRIELRGEDGRRLAGWTSAEVVRGIDAAASAFSLSLGGIERDDGVRLQVDSRAEVWIGPDPVLTGFIDRIDPNRDAKGRSVQVAGLSEVGDWVASTAEPVVWRGLTLREIVQRLADPFELDVVDEANDRVVVPVFRIDKGATNLDALSGITKERGVFVTDDTVGRIVLTRGGAGGDADALEEGVNIRSISAPVDVSERFGAYVIRGQRFDERELVAAVDEVADAGARRRRVLEIQPERSLTPQGARERARWEAVTRAGRSMTASVVVGGWRQRDGALWAPNTRTTLLDRFCVGPGPVPMVIERVTYRITAEEGTSTRLDLVRPEAFTPYTTPQIIGGSRSRYHLTEEQIRGRS